MFLSLFLAASVAAPLNYYGRIAQILAQKLPYYHVSQHPLDDEMSQRAWTNLVSFYDSDHSVFLKTDLDRLSAHELTIDDELRGGDVNFGYEIYSLYLERMRERIDFATNLLAKAEWDFTIDESYRIKRNDAPWPETREAAEDLWRRRMKNEVLATKISRELDAAEKAAKGKTDGEENQETDAKSEEPIEEMLVKKYRQFAIVMAEPDEEAILQNYLSAVARAYDPHTDYLSPASKEDFDMEMNLSLCGVGAVLSMDDGALKIVEIMPGGPIDRDGRIEEGDRITGVREGDEGEVVDIMWQPSKKSIKKIRGPKGTKVTLEILPKNEPFGAKRKLVDLMRDEIKLEDQAATGRVERITVDGREMKLGYVFLPSFYGTMDKRLGEEGFRSCALDVNRYLADFNAQGVDGLVMDLRGNGGGSLREAILLSALFVPSGPVVQIKNTRTVGAMPIPPGNAVAFRKPMVVMVDRASASASEIVAGHLQDTGRAIVVGDSRTHGKGTVQSVEGLGPEKYGSIKITNARFYRVNGNSTQVAGVASDIHLPSLLDSLDIGEDKLTYALPFSSVLPASYRICWNAEKLLPAVRAKSAERLKGDVRYREHLANVEGMKAIGEREDVPLEYAARFKMMKDDRDLRELDEDEEESMEEKVISRRKRNQKKKNDVVLDETLRILGDMVIENGGDELRPPRRWWQ